MNMKKIQVLLWLAGCLFLFVSCDKIEGPYLEKEQSVTVDTPYFEVKSDFYRKYLLEDYTGQACTNCPKAYKTSDEIVGTLKEFRQRQIPCDNIVQDWNYWVEDQWGSHQFEASELRRNPLRVR